jgi:probable phosphomutase (TIGR03848 family)
MTTILLIRHGQNDFVGKHKLAGWLPDVHLNDVGRAQADALAASLAEVKLQAIFASPLERTMETAAPIAAAQGLEVQPRPALGELKLGKWEGRSLKSLRRLKMWHRVQNAPSLARFPGGESFAEAQARIVSELDTLIQMHSSKRALIACVSHSDMIKLAVAHYVGIPLDLFQRLVVDPGSISVLTFHGAYTRLIKLNDAMAAHQAKAR